MSNPCAMEVAISLGSSRRQTPEKCQRSGCNVTAAVIGNVIVAAASEKPNELPNALEAMDKVAARGCPFGMLKARRDMLGE